MSKIRRYTLVVTAISLSWLAASAMSVATAGGAAAGVTAPMAKGPFTIGPANSPGGSVALEPNGSLVIVYDSSDTQIAVCLMSLGARKCSHVTHLTPLSGDDNYDTPQVFVTSANHVKVLQTTCCDSASAGDDLLYTSTDGGQSFPAPVRVGSLDVDAGALIGSQIVFTAEDNGAGSQVEAIPVTATGPPAGIATALSKTAYAVGVGQYKGGVLVGSDYLGSKTTTTYVEYAAKGTNFDSSASYQQVGSFSGESLFGMSGAALLTVRTGHGQAAVLRLFNGHGFGPAHVVPGTSGGGPEWFTVFQAASGRVYVFSSRGEAAAGYDLIEVSTSNGSKWSKPVNLGNAIDSTYFNAGLNREGRGLVLGTDPARGYPVG